MKKSQSDAIRPESRNADQPLSAWQRWVVYAIRFLLVLIILSVAGAISFYWLTNRPKAQRQKPPKQATLVEVTPVQAGTHRIVIGAMGTVIPARSIQLASQISGKIVEVNSQFIPGGRFRANQKILQIERKDYQLVVEQRLSDLAKSQSDLKVEMGQQSIARLEYELLAQEVEDRDKELLLRGPQLASARAVVSAVQASLEKARLDLKRTEIVAPFNAMVQSRGVDLGSHVSMGTSLAALVGTDRYWIQVSVPLDQIQWIAIPGVNSETGSSVRVFHETAWGSGVFRKGVVERLLASVETEGRMAQLIIAVDDPLELEASPEGRHPLILDAYVRAEIEARELEVVFRIDRTALRDGNQVWVMQADQTLDVRPVNIAWSGSNDVYLDNGLHDGDQLIVSDLAAPVPGMALRVADTQQSKVAAGEAASENAPQAPGVENRP